jgi:acyl-CoA synthetase (AMP-forming)/AMP-acid ligase II
MQLINHLLKWYLKKFKALNLPRDLIRFAIKRNKDKVAIVDNGVHVRYAELYERGKKLANALLKLGVIKGDRLGILLHNCREYFEIRIAAYFTGIVLVPLVWDMPLEDIVFILNDCEVKCLIYHPEILKGDIGLLKEKTGIQNFIPVPYENLISRASAVEPSIKLKETDLASINFSSGTAGKPKGIMLLQRSWANSFYNYVLNSPRIQTGEHIILHVLSFATAGGTAFLPTLVLGFKNIIMDRYNIEKAVHLILKHKVNAIFISPSHFIILLEYCKNRGIKLPLTGIMVGTEAMPQAKFKEAIEFFGPIIQEGYGMVEVPPPLSLSCSRDYMICKKEINEKILLSVGKPLAGVKAKIVDEEGRENPSGRIGKIAVKSPSISSGYWNDPELTRRHYKDGWFYSDDYGYMDRNDYLYILGRREGIIKKNAGESIFTRQVEEVLHRHPAVLEACVFSGDEGKIFACVSLRKKVPGITPAGLISFSGESLDKDAVPAVINIYPELPKNASGKLDRKKIRSDFLKRYKNG